jgi:hypothetical protein
MGRKGHPLAARIKKIMQTDEDVGKIAQATPIMIGELLLLCSVTVSSQTLYPPSHFKTYFLLLQPVLWSCSCSGSALMPAKLQQRGKPRR